jgi:hypothetical protein
MVATEKPLARVDVAQGYQGWLMSQLGSESSASAQPEELKVKRWQMNRSSGRGYYRSVLTTQLQRTRLKRIVLFGVVVRAAELLR